MSNKASAVMQSQFDKAKLDFLFEGDLLEIQDKQDRWIQTTRITFRSYDGPRRITVFDTGLVITPLDRVLNTTSSYTGDYNGPLFIYGSNKQQVSRGTYQVVYSQKLEYDEVNNRYY